MFNQHYIYLLLIVRLILLCDNEPVRTNQIIPEGNMKDHKTVSNHLKTIAAVSAASVLIVGICAFTRIDFYQNTMVKNAVSATAEVALRETDAAAPKKQEDLNLWTDDAASKAKLTEYVEAVTKPGSPDFIPVEDRIAVFDMDGTILCETDPYYFDFCLLKYRVLDDPEYKDKASAFERTVAEQIKAYMDGDHSIKLSMTDHGKAVAMAFAGMTIDEFENYIDKFKSQPEPGYNGMTRGEAFYKPMLQVIDYLQANGFKVYIVSGTDRFIVRGVAKDVVNIPKSQMIGSDETLVASGQGSQDGLDYTFTDKDKLVLGGDFIVKDLNMNKVTVIMQEIGSQPVLSFGNSSSDAAMAEYTTTNNKYRSLAFMLCCDDLVRENGNEEKADQMKQLCSQYGWVPVSMKNDWKTIYGEGVTRK